MVAKKKRSTVRKVLDSVFGENNPLIKQSNEAAKALMPAVKRAAAKRQAGANKTAAAIKASRSKKSTPKKKAPAKTKPSAKKKNKR